MLQRFRKSDKRKCRGYTLTELSIVMVVAGIVLAAVWTSGGGVKNSQRNNDALTELQTVVQNILAVMQGQTFTAIPILTDATVAQIAAGSIPSVYQSGGLAINPWRGGGSFVVWENPIATPSGIFRISFYDVSQSGCISLLLQATSCQGGQSGCPTQVGTGGFKAPFAAPAPGNTCNVDQTNCPTAVAPIIVAGTGWTGMTVAAASALCSAAVNTYPAGANNSVEFDYSL